MDGWMDGWMDVQMHKKMNGYMGRWVDTWIGGWIDRDERNHPEHHFVCGARWRRFVNGTTARMSSHPGWLWLWGNGGGGGGRARNSRTTMPI